MILRTEIVEQSIDFDQRATFVKQVVMTPGQPIGMVRKRRRDLAEREGIKGRLSDSPPPVTRGAVLLIHGFAQNRYTWHLPSRSFSCYLADRGWDVFNVDLRGAGRSQRFDAKRPEVLDEYILEDIPACAREVQRLSGHPRVALVGHSMGGLVSYCSAATALKGSVQAIATLGSPYRFGAGRAFLKALAWVLETTRLTGAFDRNLDLPTRLVGRHLHKRRALWNLPFLPTPVRGWRSGNVDDQVLDEYLARAFDRTNLQIAFDILAGGDRVALRSRDGSMDYGRAFEALRVPLLVVAGDRDDLAPPESVRPAYDMSRSPEKAYRVFPVGHMDLVVGDDATTTIWPTVGDFLDRSAP